MWILPNNHPLSSAFAQEYVESKEDLKEYFEQSEPVLMWKSKPLSWKTFLLQWKKAWWMQHLSGRTLKPSTRNHFEEKLMESLEDIHASHSPWQVNEKERMTRGTYGPSFGNTLEPYNPDGVSLRTSPATLRSDSIWLKQNWKKWVTSLRQDCTQRRKSARLIAENGSLSSQLDLVKWTTPVSDDAGNRSTKYAQGGTALTVQAKQWSRPGNLSMQVQMTPWPTPQNRDYRSPDLEGSGNLERKIEKGWTVDLNSAVLLNWPTPTTQEVPHPKAVLSQTGWRMTHDGKNSHSLNLTDTVLNWPTPATRDYKGANGQAHFNAKERPHADQLPNAVVLNFPQVKEYISTHGESPARLNPAWSIQLMGTTLQRIFTVPLAIRWLSKLLNSPSETSGEKPQTGTNLLTDDWLYG